MRSLFRWSTAVGAVLGIAFLSSVTVLGQGVTASVAIPQKTAAMPNYYVAPSAGSYAGEQLVSQAPTGSSIDGQNLPAPPKSAPVYATEATPVTMTNSCCFQSCCTPNGLFSNESKRLGRLYVDGWISGGGSTHNQWPMTTSAIQESNPSGNDSASDFQINQFYVSMGRDVADQCQWDIGGKVDLLYGADYLLVSSLGLESRNYGVYGGKEYPVSTVYSAEPHWNMNSSGDYPEYGLAMPQAYAEIYAPMMSGLKFKAGHFYSPMGYESICAPSNFFYSHSYSMLYGEPQTLTGALATLQLNSNWSLLGGFSQGWNIWEDNNGKLDAIGGFKWQNNCRDTSLSFVIMSGDSVTNLYDSQSRDYRESNNPVTNYSLVFEHKLSPLLTWVLQHDLGIADEGGYYIDSNFSDVPLDAKWYSVATYLYYQLSPTAALGFRGEWFKDENYSRIYTGATRADTPILPHRCEGDNFVDLSLGLNWKPTRWLTIRPEVRWDYSDWEMLSGDRVIAKGIYDHLTENNIFTFGGDIVARF